VSLLAFCQGLHMFNLFSSRSVAVLFGMLTPTVLLVVYHRMALILPWHFALFSVLIAASSMLWSLIAQGLNSRALRVLVLPGLSFAVLFCLIVSVVSVPLAFFSLVGFGHRLFSFFDLKGAFSLFVLGTCGLLPVVTLLSFFGQLRLHLAAFSWHGWGSKLSLSGLAVSIALAGVFGAGFAQTKLEVLMLEKPWRPNGILVRLFQFDAICEVSCRDAFIQAYGERQNSDLGFLEKNFELLYHQNLGSAWQTERFVSLGLLNPRASKP
jgi:hypothetical protein